MNETEKKEKQEGVTSHGKERWFWLAVLQMAVLLYSTTTLFSKQAAKYSFPERGYLLCYAGLIVVLGLYAVIWQQIIKHLPLTVAHANKAVSVIWGVIFAVALYGEKVSLQQIVGCVIIIMGTLLYVRADSKEQRQQKSSASEQMSGRREG